MLSCKISTDEADLSALAGPWNALQAALGLSPFTDVAWVRAWWESVGKPSGASLWIVTCWDGDCLMGVLPFSIGRKWGVRLLRYAGHDAFYMRNLLARDEASLAAMWQEVRRSRAFDFADIKNLHEGTKELEIVRGVGALVRTGPVFYCEHPGATRETLPKLYTRRLRRKLRLLSEAIVKEPALTYGFCTDLSFLDEAVPFLVEQKGAWCKKKGKTGLFDQAQVGDFYRAMCKVAAEQGVLRLYWMRRNGKLVALLIGLVFKDTFYGHTVAYAESELPIMPGFFMNQEIMTWAAEHGFRESNFMEGDEAFKERFATGFRTIYEYALARSLRGWLFLFAYVGRQRLRGLKKTERKP